MNELTISDVLVSVNSARSNPSIEIKGEFKISFIDLVQMIIATPQSWPWMIQEAIGIKRFSDAAALYHSLLKGTALIDDSEAFPHKVVWVPEARKRIMSFALSVLGQDRMIELVDRGVEYHDALLERIDSGKLKEDFRPMVEESRKWVLETWDNIKGTLRLNEPEAPYSFDG